MRLTTLCLTVPLTLVGLAGCGKDDNGGVIAKKDSGVPDNPDGGVTPDGGNNNTGFDPMALSMTLAQGQCGFYSRCVPAIFSAVPWADMNACVSEVASDIRAQYTFFQAAVTAGTVRYNADQVQACLQEYQSADCVLGPGDNSPCGRLFTGTRAANGGCSLGIECGPDLYCDRPNGLGSCGSCKAAALNQQDCLATSGNCVANTTCVQTGQTTAACVPTNAAEGGPCFTIQSGLCRGALQCVGPMQGPFTCQRPGSMTGATCSPDNTTAPTCDLRKNLACSNGTCANATWVGSGAMCNATAYCTGDTYCPGGQGSCSAPPAAGQACADLGNGPELCGTDAYCAMGNCAPQKAMGATCGASAECIGDLSCLGPAGARMCGTLNWQMCN